MLQRYTRIFPIALFVLASQVTLKAQQITDQATFPLNEYLTTKSGSPYPVVNQSKIDAIDQSKFLNVMNYGAKGDGKTVDDNAIKKAFEAANKSSVHGVLFPSGKTFLVSSVSKITLTNDLTVYAYGSTIKMKDLSGYTFMQLLYKSGSYHNKVLWLGGTLDGNQYNQKWPGNSHGGNYNSGFVEPHGRFLGVSWAEFVLFKDLNVINTVVDGPTAESCNLAVFSDSKASGGANYHFNTEGGSKGVGEQGTYFKVTRVGMKTAYFLNLDCKGGSIATFLSTPENAGVDKQTLSVHANCKIWNQAQDAVHIEDCYKNFFYNCDIGCDANGGFYIQRVHISNKTGVVAVKNSQFTNAWLNFNQSRSLKLGIIDGCTFNSTGKKVNEFIAGNPHLSTNNSFSGACSSQQANVTNVRNCKFSNFGSLAVYGAYATDGSTFTSGTTAVSTASKGFVVNCTFKDVNKTSYNSNPSGSDWKKVFTSYIDVYSDANKYLGRIDCGSASTQKITASTSTATAMSSSARQSSAMGNFRFDSAQLQSVSISGAAAINSNKISSGTQITGVYPNPTTDVLHVQLNNQLWGKTVLNVYDQQGRMVQSKTLAKNTAVLAETINVSRLTAGNYILQIINEHQKTAFKFVIAR